MLTFFKNLLEKYKKLDQDEETRMNRLMMKNIIKLLTLYVLISLMYSNIFQVDEYRDYLS